jgi:hypothetical protein
VTNWWPGNKSEIRRPGAFQQSLPPDEYETLADWLFDEMFANGFLGTPRIKNSYKKNI